MGGVLEAAPGSLGNRSGLGRRMGKREVPDGGIFEGASESEIKEGFLTLCIQVDRSRANASQGCDSRDPSWSKALLDKDFRSCIGDLVDPVWGALSWHVD